MKSGNYEAKASALRAVSKAQEGIVFHEQQREVAKRELRLACIEALKAGCPIREVRRLARKSNVTVLTWKKEAGIVG